MGILEVLKELSISYQIFEHEPVYTCEEAASLLKHIPGFRIKNIFLSADKGKKYFLLVIPENKKLELKLLAAALNVKKLSLASPRRLKQFLGIEPGAVSILALLNDSEGKVNVFLDSELKDKTEIPCHPLRNTSTIVLSMEDIINFINFTEHQINYLECGKNEKQTNN